MDERAEKGVNPDRPRKNQYIDKWRIAQKRGGDAPRSTLSSLPSWPADMSAIIPQTVFSRPARGGAARARMLRAPLPALSFALVLIAIVWLNPRILRLQPDAQSGDRACDRGADGRHRRQRAGPVDRDLRRPDRANVKTVSWHEPSVP